MKSLEIIHLIFKLVINVLHLQKDSSISTVDIDIDEDVTSSLNTLLDTKGESSSHSSEMECLKSRVDKRMHDNTQCDNAKNENTSFDKAIDSSYHHSRLDSNGELESPFESNTTKRDKDKRGPNYNSSSQRNSDNAPCSSSSQLLECSDDGNRNDSSERHKNRLENVSSSGGRCTLDLIQTHGDRIVWTYNAPVSVP